MPDHDLLPDAPLVEEYEITLTPLGECECHEWWCERDAVGIYWFGICGPDNQIHSSPCGWRFTGSDD